jgi:hypothetical protein
MRAYTFGGIRHPSYAHGRRKVGQLVSGLWRGIGRIFEKNESNGFRELLGKGIVEYEAVHSTLRFRNRIRSRRYLVGIVFPIPLYQDEAFRSQLILRRRGIFLCTRGSSYLVETGIEVNKGGGGIFQDLWSSGIARSGMLEYTKVSATKSAYISVRKQFPLHRFLVRLNVPGYCVPFVNLDPTNNVGLCCVSLHLCPACVTRNNPPTLL